MNLKWSVAAGLALALASTTTQAATFERAKEPTLTFVTVSWDVSLDAGGRVVRLHSKDDTLVPKLRDRLAQMIRGWRFSPGKIDGEPAPTQTQLQTRLKIAPVQHGFEVRIVSAGTGGGYRSIAPPDYPESAARQRRQACVVVEVHYDERGNVVEAMPYDGSAKVAHDFVNAAVEAVKHWKFQPEVVGTHPIASATLAPIMFHLEDMPAPACKFAVDGKDTDLGGGRTFALNPAAKLETDVADAAP